MARHVENKVAPDMEFMYTPVEILGNAHMHAFSVRDPANSSYNTSRHAHSYSYF